MVRIHYLLNLTLAGKLSNAHLLEHHDFGARGRLAREMFKGLVGIACPRATRQETTSKIEVMMTRILKSFADFSLKVVAVRTADDSNFGFEYRKTLLLCPMPTPRPYRGCIIKD